MRSQRGSALLVVLGMLAFMVISGIAFSVFMRSTRMSSSFTRRTATTHQLAKAALAEAIDQIDRAVANDPHPGVRNPYRVYLSSARSGRTATSDSEDTAFDPKKIDNFWCGHVLVGQGGSTDTLNTESGVPVNGGTYYPKFVDSGDTVPVLTLEALAYLPPSLVNEARYYGQRTPTAAWQTFSFDAGRFAYIAVDVSDHFDVNRIMAGEPRSSDPAHRVTLGHLFEPDDHTAAGDGAAWRTFMNPFGSGSTPPLVSLADFNLALGQRSIGSLKSPFVQYVETGLKTFYGSEPSGSGTGVFEKFGEMAFVTDSLEAPIPDAEGTVRTDSGTLRILDLDDEQNQPFTEAFLMKEQRNRTLNNVFRPSDQTPGFKRMSDRGMPTVALCALSDYLDGDRVPISLGMPSVERVPMICGIKPTVAEAKTDLKLTRKMGDDEVVRGGGPQDQERIVKRKVRWRLDPASFAQLVGGGNGVSVLAAYPFRNHEKKDERDWFEMDGKVQLFFSTAEMPLRTGNRNDLLHFGAADGEDSSPGDVKALCKAASLTQNAVFNLPLKYNGELETIPYSEIPSIRKSEDCVKLVKLVELELDRSSCTTFINENLADNKGDMLCVTYQWRQKPLKNQEGDIIGWTPEFKNEIPKIGTADADVEILNAGDDRPSASVKALGADGTLDTAYLGGVAQAPNQDITLWLNMAVTVRVKSDKTEILGASGTKTLDMVPATAYDDAILNNVDNGGSRMSNVGGQGTPLMKFLSVPCRINPQTSSDVTCEAETSPKAVMVDDPRWNHAPENWQTLATFTEAGWLAAQTSAANDGDIFMATSDQNYLQSVFELAFLPRFSDLDASGDDLVGNLGNYTDDGWRNLCEKAPFDKARMWRTYDIFGRYSDNGDDFEGLGLQNLGRGLRVNPYSDSSSVIMGAFANTPHDWRVASDDLCRKNPAGVSGDNSLGDATKFNGAHAWNEYSSGSSDSRFCWEELETVANRYRAAVRDGFRPTGKGIAFNNDGYCLRSLEDAYSAVLDDSFREFFGSAAGAGAERILCGIDLDDDCSSVFSVDKKFLYGFWRSCFAARQQLYLVFFRAEPMALGGGISGVTPPQLGARGVALVWRDPYDPNYRRLSSPDSSYARHYPQSVPTDDYRPHKTRILFYRQFE